MDKRKRTRSRKAAIPSQSQDPAAGPSEQNMETGAFQPGAFSAGDTILTCRPWVWAFRWDQHKKMCAGCFKMSNKVRECSVCHQYSYCSTNCQSCHWVSEHKHECAKLQIMKNYLESKTERRKLNDLHVHLVMIMKIVNKIKNGIPELHPGFNGSSPQEIFSQMGIGGSKKPEAAVVSFFREVLSISLEIPLPEVIPNMQIAEFYRKVAANSWVIPNPDGSRLLAMGLYLESSTFSDICDYNAIPVFHGPNLSIKAVEDIPQCATFKDIRTYGFYPIGHLIRQVRQKSYTKIYGKPCSCRLCADKYESEAIPMKCVTQSCDEPIAMDERALEPCLGCGIRNTSSRLKAAKKMRTDQLKKYSQQYPSDDMMVHHWIMPPECISIPLQLLDEQNRVGLIHPDNILRFSCLWNIGNFYHCQQPIRDRTNQAKAWEYLRPVVSLARKCFPSCCPDLACFLNTLGKAGTAWILSACSSWDPKDGDVRVIFNEALGFHKESIGIYRRVHGNEDQNVKRFEAIEKELEIVRETLNKRTDQPEVVAQQPIG